MARWTKLTAPEQLAVGSIVRDTSPGAGYVGGIVREREGGEIFDVRWLKWDPKIEAPMPDTIYVLAGVDNSRIEVLERVIGSADPEDDDTDQDFTLYLEGYLMATFGRAFRISELIAVMDKYAN